MTDDEAWEECCGSVYYQKKRAELISQLKALSYKKGEPFSLDRLAAYNGVTWQIDTLDDWARRSNIAK